MSSGFSSVDLRGRETGKQWREEMQTDVASAGVASRNVSAAEMFLFVSIS